MNRVQISPRSRLRASRWVVFLLALSFVAVMGPNDALGQKRTIEQRTRVDSTTTVLITETQDITPRKQVFTVNPLEFFIFYNFTYFRQVSDKAAIGAGLRVPTMRAVDGAGVHAEARLYPSGQALRGFYVAPRMSVSRLSAEGDHVMATSVGVRGGWQWFVGRDFSIGFGLGVDYYVLGGSEGGDEFDPIDGTVPVLRFNIGYGW